MDIERASGVLSFGSAGYLTFQFLETLLEVAQYKTMALQTPELTSKLETLIQQSELAGGIYATTAGLMLGLAYVLTNHK